MSKNAKQIIVILILLLGVSIFMAVSTYNQKNVAEQSRVTLEQQLAQYENERKELAQRAQTLEQNLQQTAKVREQLEKELQSLNRQVGDLNSRIGTLTKERDEWKTRMEGLRQERDELMARLQQQPAAPAQEETRPARSTVDESFLPGASELHWARVLKEKANMELQLEKLNKELADKAVRIGELKKKNSDMELELGAIKNAEEEESRELLARIKHNEELANNLAIELAREKNEKKVVVERLEKFKEQNEDFRSQIKRLTSTKVGLEKSLAQLSEDKNQLEKKLVQTKGMIQNEVADIATIKRGMEKKLEEVEAMKTKEIELPPIVVSAGGPGSPAMAPVPSPKGSFRGNILSINTDNNFVIVDIGENNGVKLGDVLSVYRGDKYIASLEVIQARKSISAADIKQQTSKLQVGDTVR